MVSMVPMVRHDIVLTMLLYDLSLIRYENFDIKKALQEFRRAFKVFGKIFTYIRSSFCKSTIEHIHIPIGVHILKFIFTVAISEVKCLINKRFYYPQLFISANVDSNFYFQNKLTFFFC
jgi:hypothetical protein